jgi:hypothetical protein
VPHLISSHRVTIGVAWLIALIFTRDGLTTTSAFIRSP